jgi:hypothetical protein
LAAMGKVLVKLTQAEWRPCRQNVENMVEKLQGKVSRDAVVVLFGLNNGTYYEARTGPRGYIGRVKRSSIPRAGKVGGGSTKASSGPAEEL